jgi:hypothetical protein
MPEMPFSGIEWREGPVPDKRDTQRQSKKRRNERPADRRAQHAPANARAATGGPEPAAAEPTEQRAQRRRG